MRKRCRGPELPVPAPALHDRESVEAIRIWFKADGPHCSVRPGIWESRFGVPDPHGWAVLISDRARDGARQLCDGDPTPLLRRVHRLLDKELGEMVADCGNHMTVGASGGPVRLGPRELPIPPAVLGDHDAFEIFRAWVVGGNRFAVLKLGGWRGEEDRLLRADLLGLLLSRMARQVAGALRGEARPGRGRNAPRHQAGNPDRVRDVGRRADDRF